MLELILGRAGSGKTIGIMERIRADVLAGRPGSILVVPEQYSHEAERELCAVCGDTMSLFAEVLSFTRLASRVADEYGGAAEKRLDKGGALLCMALALDAVGGRLSVFGEARRRPELQKSLLDVTEELRRAALGPEELEKAAGLAPGALGEKLSDLSLIMAAYDAAAGKSGASSADRLETLADTVREKRLGAGKRVYIDGFTDFTGLEKRVIAALLGTGAEVAVCLTSDGSAENELFELPDKTAFALRRIAKEEGADLRETLMEGRSGSRAAELDFLEENLFSFSGKRFPEKAERVSLFRADSVFDECELAAARAVYLAREKGARWRDIAVAVRGFEEYRPALESAFARYGVPLYAARRADILQKPLPAMIVSAFEIIHGGWSYEDVMACLRTGLFGLSADECDELGAYVYLWNLHGTAWTRDEPWSLHPDGYGAEFTDETRARLERINALRRRVAGPLERLARRGKEAKTAREQLSALEAFFGEIDLVGSLERRADELRELGKAELAAEYVQLWDITAGAMEQCERVLGDMGTDTEEFARLFRLVLSQYDVGTIPVSLDSVTAGDMDRMRRRHIKHLIVLGCADERLPAPGDPGGLLTDDERALMSGLGFDLGAGETDIFREFMLIYNCLTLPSESLCLSYCAKTAEGGEAGPSFVLKSAERLFSLSPRRVDTDRLRENAPLPALELAASGRSPRRLAAEAYFASLGDGRLDSLKRAADMSRGRLSKAAVQGLYGKRLRLSPSRVEALASCRYSYFLRYGLRAKPRQPAGFDPPQFGTFMHYVLENVSAEVRGLGGFKRVPEETVARLSEKYVEMYVSEELNDFRGRSPRFIYLFRRLTDTVRRVVGDMAAELRRSDFEPLDFELRFAEGGDLPPVPLDGSAGDSLYGVADRVDGWVHDGKLYVRVVDYKTGKKAFSLSDVCSGLGLQMLIYLFALEREGKSRFGRELVPAGVLYAPARDVTVSADSRPDDEELERERARRLRRSGLILDEAEVISAMEKSDSPRYIPVSFNKEGKAVGAALTSAERLGALSRFISRTLGELASLLRAGDIAADPYFRTQQDNACLYCQYADVCHFGENGEQPRAVSRMREPEAWDYIEKNAKEGGDPENGRA